MNYAPTVPRCRGFDLSSPDVNREVCFCRAERQLHCRRHIYGRFMGINENSCYARAKKTAPSAHVLNMNAHECP